MINHYRGDIRRRYIEPQLQEMSAAGDRGSQPNKSFPCPMPGCVYKVKATNMDHMVTHLRHGSSAHLIKASSLLFSFSV